jgi:hypothetical protein
LRNQNIKGEIARESQGQQDPSLPTPDLFQVDLAPKGAVAKGHGAFHFVALHSEVENGSGELAGEGTFRGLKGALDRAHGDRLAVDNFVGLKGKPATFFGQAAYLVERVFIMTGALADLANRISTPVSQHDRIVTMSLLVLQRGALQRKSGTADRDKCFGTSPGLHGPIISR